MAMGPSNLAVQAFPQAANPGQQTTAAAEPPPDAQRDIPLEGVRLVEFAGGVRFARMDRLEAYFRGRQDDHKQYNWDGDMVAVGQEAAIKPGWYVPLRQRRPDTRYDLGALVVTRLTSMLFGVDRFPELQVEGDEDAEDYIKALCTESRLASRMIEARNLGGATGTSCLSFAFKAGKPRVEVHNAKHVTVLRWADEDERVCAAVLKTYTYTRRVFDPSSGKLKDVLYYYARYWDEAQEIVWEPIPKSLAETDRWTQAPHKAVPHSFGFCPFYWVQNLANSQEPDGDSDFGGLTDNIDQMNQLLSSTARGVKANCDPTLVVRMEPGANDGSVRKGSENAIFSPGGADYLTLPGDAPTASLGMAEKLRAFTLDVASVVLADPEKLSGAAQSAQALRILYAPMLAKCDLLREQYGEFGIKRVLVGMLRAAKVVASTTVTDPVTGQTTKMGVVLPKRMVREEPEDEEPEAETLEAVAQEDEAAEAGDAALPPLPPHKEKKEPEVRFVERKPGTSEEIALNWNPYFSPTWADIKLAADAVKAANGGKPVISQRTSIEAVQSLFGVNDVDEELHEIEEASKQAMEEAAAAMGGGPDMGFPPKPGQPPGQPGIPPSTDRAAPPREDKGKV